MPKLEPEDELKPEPKPEPTKEKVTVTLEPTEITMKLGSEYNITVTVSSTGYEGELITDTGYTYWGEKPDLVLYTEFFLGYERKFGERMTIDAGETLAYKLGFWWGGSLTQPATVTFSLSIRSPHGFLGRSNAISITVTP